MPQITQERIPAAAKVTTSPRRPATSKAPGPENAHARTTSAGASRQVRGTHASNASLERLIGMVLDASPLQSVDLERSGVPSLLLKRLAAALDVSAVRLYAMIGIPKATAEKKFANGEMLDGSAGRAVIAIVGLMGITRKLVAESTAESAAGFDADRWLGSWLEAPQAALGGEPPGNLLDTAAGQSLVRRLLGSMQSGSYQ